MSGSVDSNDGKYEFFNPDTFKGKIGDNLNKGILLLEKDGTQRRVYEIKLSSIMDTDKVDSNAEWDKESVFKAAQIFHEFHKGLNGNFKSATSSFQKLTENTTLLKHQSTIVDGYSKEINDSSDITQKASEIHDIWLTKYSKTGRIFDKALEALKDKELSEEVLKESLESAARSLGLNPLESNGKEIYQFLLHHPDCPNSLKEVFKKKLIETFRKNLTELPELEHLEKGSIESLKDGLQTAQKILSCLSEEDLQGQEEGLKKFLALCDLNNIIKPQAFQSINVSREKEAYQPVKVETAEPTEGVSGPADSQGISGTITVEKVSSRSSTPKSPKKPESTWFSLEVEDPPSKPLKSILKKGGSASHKTKKSVQFNLPPLSESSVLSSTHADREPLPPTNELLEIIGELRGSPTAEDLGKIRKELLRLSSNASDGSEESLQRDHRLKMAQLAINFCENYMASDAALKLKGKGILKKYLPHGVSEEPFCKITADASYKSFVQAMKEYAAESFLSIFSKDSETNNNQLSSYLKLLGIDNLSALSQRDLLELNQICTKVYEKFCDEKRIEKESRYDIAKLRENFPVSEKF